MKRFFYFLMMHYWADRAIKFGDPRYDSEKFSSAMARSLDYEKKYQSVLTKLK